MTGFDLSCLRTAARCQRADTRSAAYGGTPNALIFRGGCECGAVLYEVELDLRQPRSGPDHDQPSRESVWEQVVPAPAFRLLSDDQSLRGYQFGAHGAHHFFCERCGVRSFSHHAPDSQSGFYSIDLKCLHSPRAAAPSR